MLGTIKDDRPNSKTILKGRLAPTDLAPFAADTAAAFAALQAQGVLNAHGRITDILCEEEFGLDAAALGAAGVTDATGLEAFLRARRPATIQVRRGKKEGAGAGAGGHSTGMVCVGVGCVCGISHPINP